MTQSTKTSFLHVLLIVIAGLIAYSGTYTVPFHFDDYVDILKNPNIKDFKYILNPSTAIPFGTDEYFKFFHSRIIGFATFALNYKLNGLNVVGYHVFNMLLHVTNAILVYFILVNIFKAPFFHNRTVPSTVALFIALFCALIFIVHPIQTQAVTYIKQRITSLATLFFLLSLLLYIRFSFSQTHYQKFVLYTASLISAIFAMKTKEIAFTLPAILMLYEMMFGKSGFKKSFMLFVPFILIMAIIPLSLIMHGQINEEATRVQTEISRSAYFFTQLRVIVTYIRLIFFPINQNLDYDYPLYYSFFNIPVILSALLHLTIFFASFWLIKRSKETPALRLATFGILWFYITLSVESSFLPIVDLINEHRLYLPSTGIILAFIALLSLFFTKEQYKKTILIIIISAVIFLTNLTFSRNLIWLDDITLWEDVTNKSPLKARGFCNLGYAYSAIGNYNVAIKTLKKGIALDPEYSETHNVLGNVYINMANYDAALSEFDLALKGTDKSLMYWTYTAIGYTYLLKNDLERSKKAYLKSIQLNPYNAEAHYGLSKIYKKIGLIQDSDNHYAKAHKIDTQKYP